MKKTFELIAKSEVLPPFRKGLRQFLSETGWDVRNTARILLAVDEVLTNIIRHAYGGKPEKIMVSVEDDLKKTEIVIEDHGKKFDPTLIPSPELPRKEPGGLGIHFTRSIMDQIVYDAEYKEGNRLRLVKHKQKS